MHYIKHNLIFSLTGTGNFRIFYGAQTLSINFVSLSTRVSRNLSQEYVWNQPTSLHWLSISFNIKFKIFSMIWTIFTFQCHMSSVLSMSQSHSPHMHCPYTFSLSSNEKNDFQVPEASAFFLASRPLHLLPFDQTIVSLFYTFYPIA